MGALAGCIAILSIYKNEIKTYCQHLAETTTGLPHRKALPLALRQATNAIGNLKDTYLSDFFHRIAYKRGRTAAVSATARNLAVIIWNMLVKHQPFCPASTCF